MTQTKPASEPIASVDAGDHTSHSHTNKDLPLLILGAIGVVYGDIGTSPIYAFREAMHVRPGAASSASEILGLLSLIVWALTLTVSLKYVFFVTRADNNGEGGTLSLVALARKTFTNPPVWITMLGVLGAALFYGDAIITPAISVLSAVEGLKLVAPDLSRWVVPITLVIILGVFFVQRFGTAKVSAVFGPVTAIWFLTLGVSGLVHIIAYPSVLWALNPILGVQFLATHFGIAFVVIGAIFLAVTGAEALYVDLGHFGRRPIVLAWFGLVFPCLLLNYFGQGAFVLSVGVENVESPFFEMQPEWALLPFVGLATLATIIASQAVITGAFSLTRQAIQLGLLPRLEIRHTSEQTSGQIFIPRINVMLLIVVLLLVWTFRTSSNLSHAYGISVFGAMMVDSLLAFIVIWKGWRWSLAATIAVVTPFLIIDVAFFSANMLKLFSGGYVPVLLAIVLVVLMWTWVRGTKILFDKTRKTDVPLVELVSMLSKSPPYRVKGMAVFLTSDPETAPASLLHNLKHNKVLHERNVILTVRSADTPRVNEDERVRLIRITDDFWRVEIVYGYMESPNVPKGLAMLRKQGFKFDIMSTSFFLSRRSIKASPRSGMPIWQDNLYIGLTKSATDATNFFQIPTGRVVEVGTQVTV
jgi:KUP system potassium uptake protein